MNTHLLPPIDPKDMASVFALLAAVKDPAAVEARLTSIASAQQALADAQKEHEAAAATMKVLAADIAAGQAVLASAKDAHVARVAAHEVLVADLQKQTSELSHTLANREMVVQAREDAVAAKETVVTAREVSAAQKQAEADAVAENVLQLQADLAGRIALIQKAQA